MGIKLEDIQVKVEEKGDMIFHKARLQLFVEHDMPLRMVDLKDREDQKNYIHHMLRQRVMAHIYGELIAPINELAILAQTNPTVDSKRITELRGEIGTILSGKDKVEIIIQ